MNRITVSQESKDLAIQEAIRVLSAGGLVIYPTETTYGVAVDVENPSAVQKLLLYKGQRDNKPISVAVSSKEMARRYVTLNAEAEKVYDTFLPGPVTVISTGTGKVAEGIASIEEKVGIRIPKYDLALELIQSFDRGITATGANASNKKRPYSIADILNNSTKSQQDLIDLIVDVGTLPANEPSTVIDTTLDDIVVLRAGTTQFHAQERVISHSVEETSHFFEQFARRYRSYYSYTPVLFAFQGEMGAGKTHAIKGIAKGLGITELITSPTYTLSHDYSFINEERAVPFVHIDAWRMTSFDELRQIGLTQYVEKKSVVAIEWSERFFEDLKQMSSTAKVILISIEPGKSEDERTISISPL